LSLIRHILHDASKPNTRDGNDCRYVVCSGMLQTDHPNNSGLYESQNRLVFEGLYESDRYLCPKIGLFLRGSMNLIATCVMRSDKAFDSLSDSQISTKAA